MAAEITQGAGDYSLLLEQECPHLYSLIIEDEHCKDGMELLVNCNFNAALDLFALSKAESPQSSAYYSFTLVLQYLTSFEAQHKTIAQAALNDSEHALNNASGIFRRRLHDSFTQNEDPFYQKLALYNLDVLSADCELYKAIITVLNMDIASYVKAGWIIRKAWRLYDSTYTHIKALHNEMCCATVQPPHVDDQNRQLAQKPSDQSPRINNISVDKLRQHLVTQLLGTVSFGYGLFHLSLSILSPQVLKIAHFFGFPSDRQLGLQCLKFCSKSTCARASMATLSLLWYHTVARPFFALDGSVSTSGLQEAQRLLNNCPSDVNTVLFMFFRGRIFRLKTQLERACEVFNEALILAGPQRELRLMCHYELGWCHLLQLDWTKALVPFEELKANSKWAPSYYYYLCALCQGGNNNVPNALLELHAASKHVQKKSNPVEAFVIHRVKTVTHHAHKEGTKSVSSSWFKLLAFEVMYIWRAMSNCANEQLGLILAECNKIGDTHLFALKCLIEGAVFCQMQRVEIAIQCFEECITRCENAKEDKHIAAFACYELGLLSIQNENTKDYGRQRLEQARDKYKNYHFENRLSVRVYAALKMVNGQAATAGLPNETEQQHTT